MSSSIIQNTRNRLRRRPGLNELEEKLEEEKKRADDQTQRANELFSVAKDIQLAIIRLAEKFKDDEKNLYEDVGRYCSEDARFPECIFHLVDVLVRWYAHQWTLLKNSERWEVELWKDCRRLVDLMGRGDTTIMRNYETTMLKKRQDQYEKLKGFVARSQAQFEKLQVLESENAKLKEQQEIANTEKSSSAEHMKQEYEKALLKMRVQDKTKYEKDLKEALRANAEVYENQTKIAKEEYDKSKAAAEAKFEADKGAIRRQLEEEKVAKLKEQGDIHTESIKLYIKANTTLEKDLENSKANLQVLVDEAVKDLKKELQKTKDDWTEDKEAEKLGFLVHLDRIKETNEEAMTGQRIELEGEIRELRDHIAELEHSQEELVTGIREEHDMALNDLAESHITQTSKIREDAELEISQLNDTHAQRELALEQRISALEDELKTETSTLRSNIIHMQTEHEKLNQEMAENFKTEKEELEQKANAEILRIKTEFQKKKANLEAIVAEETSQLRKDLESYSAALLARDDFKPLPDNEIRTKFSELAEEVKNVGRMEWKADQKAWTIDILQRLCPANTSIKIFKRHILQEMVWIILHKHILCSPFRPFGKEGAMLEDQWEAAHGADENFRNGCYTWPAPEMECERDRYVNVKECRAAVRSNIMTELDPRANIKKGFKATMEDIRDDFVATIGELIDLTKIPMKVHLKAMDKAAIKAANVWLEFGMQRCRIILVFPTSSLKSAEEKIKDANRGSIELILTPELKRYGNPKGFELHTEASVPGCLGERIQVSAPAH